MGGGEAVYQMPIGTYLLLVLRVKITAYDLYY